MEEAGNLGSLPVVLLNSSHGIWGARTPSSKACRQREGRRIYIWPANSAKADMLEKIIAKYQVPWKHLLIPGTGAPMELALALARSSSQQF